MEQVNEFLGGIFNERNFNIVKDNILALSGVIFGIIVVILLVLLGKFSSYLFYSVNLVESTNGIKWLMLFYKFRVFQFFSFFFELLFRIKACFDGSSKKIKSIIAKNVCRQECDTKLFMLCSCAISKKKTRLAQIISLTVNRRFTL